MMDTAIERSDSEIIPGFYRDPMSGRYFREKSDIAGNVVINKMKKAKELADLKAKYQKLPKHENVLKHLRARELGPIGGVCLNSEYYKMKTFHKRLIEDMPLNNGLHEHNITGIDFLTGGERSVFGMWNINDNTRNRFVLGEHKFLDFPEHENLTYRPSPYFIIDMCEGPQDTIVCLYHDPSPFSIGCFEYLPRDSPVNFRTFFSNSSAFSKSSLFCCAVGKIACTYAVGSEGFIRYYNGFNCETTYFVDGRVHTIAFDDSASVMVSGVHHGTIYLHDARAKKIQFEMKVSEACVTGSRFLDSEHLLISGVGEKILNVDLRAMRVSTEYFGHMIQTTRKKPFSVANNMLCASGSDNVVRIWHLSGGHPIHEIKPFDDVDNEIRGWLHGEGDKTHLYFFEGNRKKIFHIC